MNAKAEAKAADPIKSEIAVTRSSGNVFADLGLEDAEERLVKSRLAIKIGQIIKARKLTQVEAASLLNMTQPKLSNLLRGKFDSISEKKMMECLTHLGRDIQIVVRPAKKKKETGHIEVVFC